ncbi:MAG: pitrilysin family protein [Acidobacteriota bacterium]|nr:pitrilysin family protein [Acidobacteriota bacterium]
MRLLTLLFSVGVWLLSPAVAGDKVFPYEIQKGSLDNGLQVITVPFDSPGIVSFFVVVRVGSREEVEKGVTGFAHFFEHMMFRGTERFSNDEYNKKLQEIAAAGNANTWLDRTLYYFTGNASMLETMFDIESDRFRFLKYEEHDFKTEAGAVLGEYTKNFANPFRQFNERLVETVFTKHTYGHTTMGYLDDIKDMPNQYEYSLTFFDRFYRPEYCTVMVVGDAQHPKVMELSKKYFGEWERGSYQPNIPVEPPQKAEKKAHVTFPGRTNMVGVYYRTPAFSDTEKDLVALDLLFSMGFSEKSEIYKKLVRNEQKVRFIFADVTNTRDPYITGVVSSVYKVEDTAYVRDEIDKAIESFKTTPVETKELDALKSRRRYGMAGSLDTPFAVGNTLAYYIWLTGDPESLNREYQIMDSITPEDMINVAKKYLTTNNRTVVTLSAEEEGR